MFEAWQKLQCSEEYNLTIDLFKVGIIQKKQGKEKENFTLKIKNILFSL